MDERKPTPEEQLLKLIENPSAGGAAGAAAQTALKAGKGAASARWLQALSNVFKTVPAESKSALPQASSGRPFPYVKGLNAILVAATLAAVIYLVLDVFVLKKNTQDVLTQVSVADQLFPVQGEEDPKIQRNIQYYQDLIDRRNPFVAGAKPVVEEKKPEAVRMPAAHSEKMNQVLQTLRLVGISWTGQLPLAMIEEVQSGKTFFLKEGQELNRLRVQKIDKEKVTVTYEGEEADLF